MSRQTYVLMGAVILAIGAVAPLLASELAEFRVPLYLMAIYFVLMAIYKGLREWK